MNFDVAELVQRAGQTRQAELVLPAIVPPVGLERDVLAIYLRVVRQWGRECYENIMPEYERTRAELVKDSPADVEQTVEESSDALTRLVLTLGPELENWVVRVEQWHRGRFVQLFTPAGIRLDTLLGRGDVARTLESVLAENLALIRSLNEQMRNGISGAVFRGLQNRDPARTVAKEIRRVTGVARSRAELIAADQLQKLSGRLDQERQQQLGINEFEWQHSHKKYPRPEHVARDGKRYAWNSAIGRSDPPGRAIRCGCRARPVVRI